MTKHIYVIRKYKRNLNGQPMPGGIADFTYCYTNKKKAKEKCKRLNEKTINWYYDTVLYLLKEDD